MVLGVIDIGSHSCRLKIIRCEGAGRPQTLVSRLLTTRLMEGVAETGVLSARAMEETLQALLLYQADLRAHDVQAFRVIATSAMREAENGAAFAERIREKTGITVEIISGEEEAAFSYAGMRAAMPEAVRPLLLDVGGGSTEFYVPGIIQQSVRMGAVRGAEEGLDAEKAVLLLSALLPVKEQLAACTLTGCGGTITTIAAIFHRLEVYDRDVVQGSVLTRTQIVEILSFLAALPLEARRKVPGLQPKRADVICTGIFWVLQIMDFLQADSLTVSDADLLDGVLFALWDAEKQRSR